MKAELTTELVDAETRSEILGADAASGLWVLEQARPCRALVFRMEDYDNYEDDDEVEEFDEQVEERATNGSFVLLLDSYGPLPAYTRLDLTRSSIGEMRGVRIGQARIVIDESSGRRCNALLGRLIVRNGGAGIVANSKYGLNLLYLPQDYDFSDGDYGFKWAVMWEYQAGCEAMVYSGLDYARRRNANWRRFTKAM